MGSAETVLVVDDEEPVRKIIRQFLAYSGYTVLEAAQADEALLIAKGHRGPIHLLLTDIRMPGLNGFDLAEKLEPMRPAMKVLYMSAYQQFKSGADLYKDGIMMLDKPFAMSTLLGKVRDALAPANSSLAQRSGA